MQLNYKFIFSITLLLLAASRFAEAIKADKVLILKKQHVMHLLKGGKVLKRYHIALGANSVGPKEREGDRRTPEGIYKICGKNPNSQFYKSLRISYPNAADRARAKKRNVNPGGDIMIHGLPKTFRYLGKLHLSADWTLGCIAVTNSEMDDVWSMVDVGTIVEIRA